MQGRLSETYVVSNASYNSARKGVDEVVGAFLGPDVAPQIRLDVVNTMSQDQRFMFDPDVRRPQDGLVGNLRNQPGQWRPPVSDEVVNDLILKVKDMLARDDLVRERVAVCRSILPDAEAIHARILTRMKDPFES